MFWKEAPHLLALAMELKKGLFIGLSKETPSPVPPKVKMANTKSASFCLLPGVWAQDPDRALAFLFRKSNGVGGQTRWIGYWALGLCSCM